MLTENNGLSIPPIKSQEARWMPNVKYFIMDCQLIIDGQSSSAFTARMSGDNNPNQAKDFIIKFYRKDYPSQNIDINIFSCIRSTKEEYDKADITSI
jgi:hypothetical protein